MLSPRCLSVLGFYSPAFPRKLSASTFEFFTFDCCSFSRSRIAVAIVLVCTFAVLPGCGKKGTELGGASSEVIGAAGPAGANGANQVTAKCTTPVATLALVENPRSYVLSSSYNLPISPVPLVRLLAQ